MEFKSKKEIKRGLKATRTSHPFALTSVGCVWKNPAGKAADHLIERAGLRSKGPSGVEISTKRANVIANRYRRRGSRQNLREP